MQILKINLVNIKNTFLLWILILWIDLDSVDSNKKCLTLCISKLENA